MTFARVRALVVVGVLLLAAFIFVIVAVVRDSQAGSQASVDCPAGWPKANIELPAPKQVKIKVFNATDTDGLGAQVTEDFKNRDFQTQKPGPNPKVLDGVAALRYGPKAVGAAHLLRAYFLLEAEPRYDPKRTNDVVDVVIGADFKQLATTTEVNQALVELGEPELPEGACAADQA